MADIVGVTRGTDKFAGFNELLKLTDFDDTLVQALEKSNKTKSDFKIVIKPNIMTFLNPKAFKAVVTDKELVEYLVDHIIQLGFNDISVCEAQNDGSTMLKNHNVEFVSRQIGYSPEGRYTSTKIKKGSSKHGRIKWARPGKKLVSGSALLNANPMNKIG